MKIVVLPGDGIGPETMAVAVDVIEAASQRFGLGIVLEHDVAGHASMQRHGTTVWPELLDKVKAADALIIGNANIMPFIRNAVLELTTVHHGHMPEIEIISSTSAKGIWAMEDVPRWPTGAAVKTLHGYGHYHETYRKTEDGWRIQSSRLSRLRVDIT